ncbi:uncharacterized protein [Rutidosis leptorrhynchoides]|uniref:uncharacterized protein n=1 Tax=Rutidosis leptorrhynchoides TaxID=125765 RepID=UPI003A98F21E
MEDQKSVIIFDLTTFSIALDENLGAKIVDFGLSIVLPPNQNFLRLNSVLGSPFYMEPEYQETGTLRRESDVYTLGVILFKILCGRVAFYEMYKKESKAGLVNVARRCFLKGTLMEIIDPLIIKEANKDSIDTFVKIAYRCVAETQNNRPKMNRVVKELEKALEQTQCQEQSEQVVDGSELAHVNLANLFGHLRIRLSDIFFATNNFSKRYRVKGDGNCYYYGGELEHFDQEKFDSVKENNRSELLKKRSTVLIKRLQGEYKDGRKLVYNEIEMLTTCKHPNTVTLVGFCDEDLEMILVFEIPIHDFLSNILMNKEKSIMLTWSKRLRICLDVAYGLKYLHYDKEDEKMILQCAIWSSAIIVDENFRAKICEFRYSAFLRPNQNDFDFDLDFLTKTFYHMDPDFLKMGKEVTNMDWHMWPENASTMEH